MQPVYISPYDTTMAFPNVELALDEPNGLLAVGGDLSTERLIHAYCNGIFPWFNDDQPILWWSPNPRMVLRPDEIQISRSLKKTLRKTTLRFSIDTAFEQVIFSCSQPRPKQPETWITKEMSQAYIELHKRGFAHSFETWQDNTLVGGLYGIAIGKVFFGESMFSTVTDASKIAFARSVECLAHWGYELIDCQVETPHLASFGACNILRQEFIQKITQLVQLQTSESAWVSDVR